MLSLFIKKLVLVKMRNGKKEKALKILTDCCFYLKKYNVTLKKNISFLDFFKKIFFNLQPTMKKKYVYYGRRKESENSSLNNSRLDVQQLRLPIN
jgi:ribosomal protein S7